ncbi:hypothetical protein WICPIJ_007867 [Wickerhamomyces pijperi]|uniref:SANT domain-containing protein n=1 Tax=Wickerhamomyces pijperi TaxID=599730 RepID=A0A9P8PZR2_WICPI|nr:hypothetical protein WICPIJ_007867 [Wickerhamomyces pijperi]
MSSDGSHRSGSSGRSFSNSSAGSYGNSNYESGSGYNNNPRHGRYNGNGGYSNYKRYDRPNSASNGYQSNNSANVPPKQYSAGSTAPNERSNRPFGQHYANGSSYIPTRKWGNSYQPTRSDSNGYNKKHAPYKNQPKHLSSQIPNQATPDSSTFNRNQPMSNKPYQQRQSQFKNDGYNASDPSNKQRGRSYPVPNHSNKGYDYSSSSSSPSKQHPHVKDREDLFAQKWNGSYSNDSRGYERNYDESYYKESDGRHGYGNRYDRTPSSSSFDRHAQSSDERKVGDPANIEKKPELKSIDNDTKADTISRSDPANQDKEVKPPILSDVSEAKDTDSKASDNLEASTESNEMVEDLKDERVTDEKATIQPEPVSVKPLIATKPDQGESKKDDSIQSEAQQEEVPDAKEPKQEPQTAVEPRVDLEVKSDETKVPELESSHDNDVKDDVVLDDVSALEADKNEAPKVPIVYSETAIFPMTEFDDKIWQLKRQGMSQIKQSLPHLLRLPVKRVQEYEFFSNNELVHAQGLRDKLLRALGGVRSEMFSKKQQLLNQYKKQLSIWEEQQVNIEKQLTQLYPNDVTSSNDGASDELSADVDEPKDLRSRGRSRIGDSVRSEAEFLEILKTLGEKDHSDPILKAEEVAAKIPDMILDPIKAHTQVQNVNNRILDKKVWASRIHTDGVDNFTRKEHETFCEIFLQYPKRFGKISALMGGLRTAEECVLHYYRTKKTLTDYKQMLQMKKKRNRKSSVKTKRGSKSKTPTTSTPNTPTLTSTTMDSESEKDFNINNFIPQEVIESEELYTDTGRRKRAAAPVFETHEKNAATLERKRSLSAIEKDQQSTDAEQSHDSKQQAKKKPRIQKPKTSSTDVKADVDTNVPGAVSVPVAHTLAVAPKVDEESTKPHITSYWSVKDSHLFVQLLSEHGTNWDLLAEKLKTKSPIMVRNYYQRNNESIKLQKSSSEAVKSLARGLQGSDTASATAATVAADTPQPGPGLETPPLGVFTAHNTIPSNIQFIDRPQLSGQQTTLPSISASIPTANGWGSQGSSIPLTLPSTHVRQPSQISAAKPDEEVKRRKQNPFSITSLLNPSDEYSSSPSPTPTSTPAPFDSKLETSRMGMSSFLNPSPPNLPPIAPLPSMTNAESNSSLKRLTLDSLLDHHNSDTSAATTATTLPSLVRTNPMSISNALGEASEIYYKNGDHKTISGGPLSETNSNTVLPFSANSDLKRSDNDKFGCP